ncbi:MAG: hypothetical protein J6C31_04700 [Prevotella sp.]|nr:hypothetical protein [Prevotella sp.]
MKRIVKIMCVLLMSGFFLSLLGCKTKEKVSEIHKENVWTSMTETKTEMCLGERLECDSSAEQTLLTSEKDSLVEKFWERIVTDSCGRILFKDSEYTKERYLGKGITKENRKGSNYQTAKGQIEKQSQEKTDTSSTAIRESTQKTVKQTYRWFWFLGLLIFLFACGFIISKVTR